MSRAAHASWRRKLAGSSRSGRRVARAELAAAPHRPHAVPSWAASAHAPVGTAPTRSWRRIALLAFSELILTLGAILLLYVIWTLVVADSSTRSGQAHAADDLHAAWSQAQVVADPVENIGSKVPSPGSAFGVLYVPRFGDDWHRPIVEGVELTDLDRGAGHYGGTALPGEVGNFAVAGHRLTHGSAFMKIADLRLDDPIVVETPKRWFVYRVTATLIVTPDRVDVLAPVPESPGRQPTRATMTLTSCNPLFGHTHRYIVHAELVGSQPHADGMPQIGARTAHAR